jgi:hypothetical protein
LNGKGHALEQLAEAGLVNERDNGSYYDKFRNRIIFPIRDAAGKMLALADGFSIPPITQNFLTLLKHRSSIKAACSMAYTWQRKRFANPTAW